MKPHLKAFIPGSHHTAIVPHILYEGGIHGELPREYVEEFKSRYGLHHIEMEPGDCVCWHSSLYHYSPPNTSEQSRISLAGVYSTPAIADATGRGHTLQWCLRDGQKVEGFPPETYVASGESQPMPPFLPAAEYLAQRNGQPVAAIPSVGE